MTDPTAFLAGLADRDSLALLTRDDFDGPLGPALRRGQACGFVTADPVPHPHASCPHCPDGVPFPLAGRDVCSACLRTVAPDRLLAWVFDRAAFLRWLAGELGLRGAVQMVGRSLWWLGVLPGADGDTPVFYRRTAPLSDPERRRVAAVRRGLVVFGLLAPPESERGDVAHCSLLELLLTQPVLTARSLAAVLLRPTAVRFDPATGVLWDGGVRLGDVPLDAREYFFLTALAARPDEYVGYAELKAAVLRGTDGADGRDEATFCHRLKSGLKARVPALDRYLLASGKAHGYRLRGAGERREDRESGGRGGG